MPSAGLCPVRSPFDAHQGSGRAAPFGITVQVSPPPSLLIQIPVDRRNVGMGKPFAVKVVGPLEPYVTDYRGKLLSLGYSPWSATAHLHVMRHLSQWLADRGLSGEEFTESRLAEFV